MKGDGDKESGPIKPISFSAESFDQITPFARKLGWTNKYFVERCVLELVEMMKQEPNERTVPKVVDIYDTEMDRKERIRLPNSTSSDVAKRAAEKLISERLKKADERKSLDPAQPPSSQHPKEKPKPPGEDPPK